MSRHKAKRNPTSENAWSKSTFPWADACTSQGRTANAKDVTTLCAPSDAMVHVTAIDTDANEAVQALVDVLPAADPARDAVDEPARHARAECLPVLHTRTNAL